jgi:Rrf2 family cysteine metabolism transcriptional repressor
MKISYKCDYALKTLLELSFHYNKGVLSINDLAKRGDIPVKFLEQVLLMLKKGGFVESKRGISGGYSLSRPPEDITIGEALRFIEGPVEPIACINNDLYDNCKDFKICVFRDIWNQVYTATSLVIDTVTFAELVRKVGARKVVEDNCAYSI